MKLTPPTSLTVKATATLAIISVVAFFCGHHTTAAVLALAACLNLLTGCLRKGY